MQKWQTRKIAKMDIPVNFIGEAFGLVGVIAVGQRGGSMSLITTRIKRLRELSTSYETAGDAITRELLREAADTIEMLSDKAKSTGWIPCSERLPEDGTWNLFTDGNMVSVERYKADAMDHFYPNGRWFSLDEAIAWMPLPKSYQVESE